MEQRARSLWRMLATIVVVLGVGGCTNVPAQWTTYRGDAQRSGVDSTSWGSTPIESTWTSPSLDADVYGQPLVYGGAVVTATEGDDVYALSQATGRVVWHVHLGTAVPAGQLPCGDIAPTVGITSTAVIDPSTNRVFVVAATWDGSTASTIHHELFGLNLADGSVAPGFPIVVDPPQNDPRALLQRTALALDAGKIVIGYGGNAGDCGTYNGWLVAVPESGGAQQAFEVDPSASGGAIWGSGDGPAVDSAGNVWVATGNGFGSGYGYQESVLELNAGLGLLDHWAPADWQLLDLLDLDLGSADPLLLPDGLAFVIGKAGVGYLLSTSTPGGITALYSAQVCATSFGGAVYDQGTIYVACGDGLRALLLDTTAHMFTPLVGWHVQPAAIGPPIVSGGRVWVTGWNSAQLFGLDLHTGQVVINQPTPPMAHFATPSAANGTLFLATGQTMEAYTIGYSLVVAGTGPAISFGARSIAVGESTPLTVTMTSHSAPWRIGELRAIATLTPGLVVAPSGRAHTSCGHAVARSPAGSSTITLSGDVDRVTRCSVTVWVRATDPGVKSATVAVDVGGRRAVVTPSARLVVTSR